jgi:hypothetical protein
MGGVWIVRHCIRSSGGSDVAGDWTMRGSNGGIQGSTWPFLVLDVGL